MLGNTPSSVLGDAQVADGGQRLDAGATSYEAGAGLPDAGDAQLPTALDAQVPGDAQPDDAGIAVDAGDAAPPARGDLGKGAGKDVVLIGDSWMLLTFTGIQESLTKASGQPYRKYGFPGTQMLTGDIPQQFDRALREGADIETVVMTGGGNDILLSGAGNDCPSGGPNCEAQLGKISDALVALWKKMSASGVQDVVHVMYSAKAVASNPVKNLPAHNQKLAEECASVPAPMRCHELNTDQLATQLRGDGIHPTDAEYDAIGRAVLDLMTREGMRR